MQRRAFTLLTIAAIISGLAQAASAAKMFPTNLPSAKWVEFKAQGFEEPVSGVIYRPDKAPCCGVPLGGVATGCIDIDASGTFGFNTLFNMTYLEYAFAGSKGNVFKTSLTRKIPDYTPFLGLSVGNSTWVLASRRILDGGQMPTCVDPVFINRTEDAYVWQLSGVNAAKNIHYWGHYPVVDMEYDLEKPGPVSVGLRAWSPFIPGDLDASSTPCAYFDVSLRNDTGKTQKGTLAFNFPGPISENYMLNPAFTRKSLSLKNMTGVDVTDGKHGYVIGVLNNMSARIGGGLDRVGGHWAGISKGLPGAAPNQPSTSILVDFNLKGKESTVISFVLAWHAPDWDGHGDFKYTSMYATRFKNAQEVVEQMAPRREELLNRVLAWQQVVYGEKALPPWLRDTLVNNLALIPEVTYWAQPKAPLDWAPKDGLFGMLESPRGCPQIECIPCSFYGNLPIVYFFPQLAKTSLAGYRQYMSAEGAVPFFWGTWGRPDMATPNHIWQISLNGPCFVIMVDRLWQRTGDKSLLEDYYPAVKKNTTFTMNLRPTVDGVISMPTDNAGMEWFEWGEWCGMCAHTGGLRLATVKIVERMAEAMGDKEYADQCRTWLKNGSNAMENKLWNKTYYLNFYEEETGKKSDAVMAYQLDGEWVAQFHGFSEGVFRQDRVPIALDWIKRSNTPNVICGAANFAPSYGVAGAKVDAKVAEYGNYSMFLPEVMMLSMTYIYAGEREYGTKLLKNTMDQMVCVHRHPWDLPNALLGDTGKRQFGTDYYQNMMLWAVPMALEKTDIAGSCKPDGLIGRIVAAGRDKSSAPTAPSGYQVPSK